MDAGAAPPSAGLHLGRARMMTLDAFLEDRLASGRWPLNAYVKERGFSSLYVRISQRHILGETRTRVLDIANVEAKRPGAGAFTSLVRRLQLERPDLGLFVECVLNISFRKKLLALGFQLVSQESDPTPSFWLPPTKEEATTWSLLT